jgi:hypothetical protein
MWIETVMRIKGGAPCLVNLDIPVRTMHCAACLTRSSIRPLVTVAVAVGVGILVWAWPAVPWLQTSRGHSGPAGPKILTFLTMSNVQQTIRDAAEKGGYRYRWWKVDDLEPNEGYNGLQLRALSEHLQDPDFWKALATARKWEDINAWRFHWHRFIDHLADGKDAENFFASL